MAKIRDALLWVYWISRLSPEKRREIKTRTFAALSRVSEYGEGYKDTRAGMKMVSELKMNYDFRGFAFNLEYLKESGTKEELAARHVHPFSLPALVFSHKTLPMVVLTHPTLRWNKSVLHEMKENQEVLEYIFQEPLNEQIIVGATS